MNSFKFLLPLALLVASCGSETDETASAESFERSVNVAVDTVSARDFVNHVNVIGTVKSTGDITISAEVSGMVTRIPVREGSRFKKGDLILKIDDSSLLQELEIAKANASTARESFERSSALWKESRIGSEFAVLAAENQAKQAQANLELIQIRVAKSNIIAPFDGMLERRFVEQGEMAAPGTPLLRLIRADDLHVEAGVPARYAGQIKVGDPVLVRMDVDGGMSYQGRVISVANSVDPGPRTFNVKVSLGGNHTGLKVDLVANLRLEIGRRSNVVVVSQEYVQRDESGYKVFTVINDNGTLRAKTTYVNLGADADNQVIIESGLNTGDIMITRGAVFAENNIKLNIQSDSK
jgi:membrane fusion protein, multidrug efflux system